jgi:hypothetical protein
LFQLEAPGDGDDMVATAEGETLDIEETAEDQTQAGSSQEDAEANVGAERAEVLGSGVYCLGVHFL